MSIGSNNSQPTSPGNLSSASTDTQPPALQSLPAADSCYANEKPPVFYPPPQCQASHIVKYLNYPQEASPAIGDHSAQPGSPSSHTVSLSGRLLQDENQLSSPQLPMAISSQQHSQRPSTEDPPIGDHRFGHQSLAAQQRTDLINEVEFCVLRQQMYPQTILSVGSPAACIEASTPQTTVHAVPFTNLTSSIRDVLAIIGVEPASFDAFEVIGNSISEVFSEQSSSENAFFGWAADSGCKEGYREVFRKHDTGPNLLLTFESKAVFNIYVRRGSRCGPHSINSDYDIWSLSGPTQCYGNPQLRCFQLTLRQDHYGFCSLQSAGIIRELPDGYETSFAPIGWRCSGSLAVRCALPQISDFSASDMLKIDVALPVLYDKSGKKQLKEPCFAFLAGNKYAMQFIEFLDNLNWELIITHSIQGAASISCVDMPPAVCIAMQGMQAGNLLVISAKLGITIARLRRPYGERCPLPRVLVCTGAMGSMVLIPVVWAAITVGEGNLAAPIVMLVVGVTGLVIYVVFIFCCMCAITKPQAHYGDYLMLGADLKALEAFPGFMETDESKSKELPKDLQACLDHYESCEIDRILAENDTPVNQEYWKEMAVLSCISNDKKASNENLRSKCPYSAMAPVQMFHFAVTRMRELCKRLEFSQVPEDWILAQLEKVEEDPSLQLLN